MTRRITPQTTLDNLKKEAKRWLKELRAHDATARLRLTNAYPGVAGSPGLRDVQHALALEFGLAGWTALKRALDERPDPLAVMERLANDMVEVYATGDAEALEGVKRHYGRSSTVDDIRATVWRHVYKVRRGGGGAPFGLAEAQELIARTAGFGKWSALAAAVRTGTSSPLPIYSINAKENSIGPVRDLSDKEWEILLAVMKEQKITKLEGRGRVPDRALELVAGFDHVTALSLGGSRQISDEGLQHLARMPQLEYLNLNDHPGGKLTDNGLPVLRRLPNLRTFHMTWQRGISDAGSAHLKFCDKLEFVDLRGTLTGDGAIEALRGKPYLRQLRTGKLVSDAGLAMLREVPLFKNPLPTAAIEKGGETELLIDGPFTNNGVARLAGLAGLCGLDLFWHVTNITAEAFQVVAGLPNLLFLGCDGDLSNDEAMRHIAAAPRLRKLRAQGSVATDDGFRALSRSQTLEDFWGRECPHLTGRGFRALSTMPALRVLGVSCKNVDDTSLASLPHFPSLSELTPIGVTDEGFRHVGHCPRLERLACMYCRETTDAATEQIAGLQLKSYYAGLTKITDRSLEILSRMVSLQSVQLFETKSVTDAGLAHLAKLPRLNEVKLSGLPDVTFAGSKVFANSVSVEFDV